MARPVTCPAKTEPESMNPGVPMEPVSKPFVPVNIETQDYEWG